jgi:general secretion pathway protein J
LRRARGMTLIEIMVALAILTMMVAAIWSSFRSTMKGMETTEVVQDRYNTVRNAINRMSSDMAMAYLSFNRPPDETRHFTYFEGRTDFGNDSVTFSTFGHLRVRKDSNESDQSIVQYFVAADPEDGSRQHLWRREDRRLHGDKPEDIHRYAPAYILCEDVASLELEYWDTQREEFIQEWATMVVDAQPDRLPPRVKIKLGILNGDDEIEYFTTQAILPMQEKIDFSK